MKKKKSSISFNKKKEQIPKTILISAALKDISRELSNLQKKRKEIGKSLQLTVDNLSFTQSKELNLRNKLSSLISKEDKLADMKDKLQQDINSLKQKIEKVSKIRQDLKTI